MKEFITFVKMIYPEVKDHDVEIVFNSIDSDNSNHITIEEFKTFFMDADYEEKKEDNSMLDEYRAGKLLKKLVDVILDDNINIDKLFKKFDMSGD